MEPGDLSNPVPPLPRFGPDARLTAKGAQQNSQGASPLLLPLTQDVHVRILLA